MSKQSEKVVTHGQKQVQKVVTHGQEKVQKVRTHGQEKVQKVGTHGQEKVQKVGTQVSPLCSVCSGVWDPFNAVRVGEAETHDCHSRNEWKICRERQFTARGGDGPGNALRTECNPSSGETGIQSRLLPVPQPEQAILYPHTKEAWPRW